MSATENAIEQAIAAHAEAEGWKGITTGWMVLAATVDHNGEDEISGVAQILPGGAMNWPMALGLVEATRVQLHDQFRNGQP